MSEPGKSPRQFSSAFKEGIVLRLEAGEPLAASITARPNTRRNPMRAASSGRQALDWRD
jgi:hypothetical protein